MNVLLKIPLKFYHFVTYIRNSLYNRGIFRIVNVEIPVISVGNLSFGGTGKTPMTIWIARNIQEAGFQVVILSRGYKRKSWFAKIVSDKENMLISKKAAGDEPYLMAKKLKGVPVIVSKNRVRGANLAKKRFQPRVIILDDGFQHRKIVRNMDIVLMDSPETLRNNTPLRETAASLRRANAVIFTKYDQFENVNEFEKEMKQKLSCSVFLAKFKAVKLINESSIHGADYLKGKTVWMVAGIGNPKYFRKIVENLGAHVSKSYIYRDHAKYPKWKTKKILKKFAQSTADLLLTTEKDWYKFKKHMPADSICYYLDIDMDIIRGKILLKGIFDSASLSKFEDLG